MYEYVVIILTYHLVVTIRMSKLTIPQRKELKDLCKETLIRKLSQKESHAFVNSKLDGFNISYDYVQKVRNEISKNAKEELLHLERDQYALIQSLFFDRKDELEQMQKVLWSMIEKNQLNPDIQIQAIEKLQELSDQLARLYRSLPYTVEFGAKRHFYIHNIGIMTPEQQQECDRWEEWRYHKQFEKDFVEMKKNNPTLYDEAISEKIDTLYDEELYDGEDTAEDPNNILTKK
jgi:hypothetical protein